MKKWMKKKNKKLNGYFKSWTTKNKSHAYTVLYVWNQQQQKKWKS